jgi:hypothetical protein
VGAFSWQSGALTDQSRVFGIEHRRWLLRLRVDSTDVHFQITQGQNMQSVQEHSEITNFRLWSLA